MRIFNKMGNEYKGTIGKSVTASNWKGRNYLKKWFKPTNPNSGAQQTIRGYMAGAVSAWHGYNAIQKRAYFWYQRYRKANISPFNALTGLWIFMEKNEGAAPNAPPTAGPSFIVAGPTALEGVKCIIRKAGQATDYYLEYSDGNGETPSSVPERDQNYDLFATKAGYQNYSSLDKTAAQICVEHTMVAV